MPRPSKHDAEFTEFIAARADQLYRSAYLLTTTPHGAEDLVQTALVKAYAAWGRVRGADDPVAYVNGILVKAFLSERRRRSSSELPTDTQVLHDREVAQPGTEPTERMVLVAALARLSPLDRAVVLLRHWEDRSVAETAAELRLSPAAVKNRSLRALRVLRAELGEPPDEPAAARHAPHPSTTPTRTTTMTTGSTR